MWFFGVGILGAERTGRVFVDVLVVEYGADDTDCTSTLEMGMSAGARVRCGWEW